MNCVIGSIAVAAATHATMIVVSARIERDVILR